MIPRILEPEVMADAQEAIDYDAMDHAAVNHAFVADLLSFAPELLTREASALDLGAGTALITIELALQTSQLHITARDMSKAMLEQAARNIASKLLESRITTELADAKTPSQKTFDAVISNSVVHHITRPITLVKAALQATAPGGVLFIRDLVRPESKRDLDTLVYQYATPPTSMTGRALAAALRQRDLFAASLHAALTVDEITTVCQEAGIPTSAITRTSDRHWTLAHRV